MLRVGEVGYDRLGEGVVKISTRVGDHSASASKWHFSQRVVVREIVKASRIERSGGEVGASLSPPLEEDSEL